MIFLCSGYCELLICLATVTAVIQRALTPLSNDSTGIPREHADGLLLILELVPIVVEVIRALLCTTTTVHYYLHIVVVVVLPLLPLPRESANGFLLILELELVPIVVEVLRILLCTTTTITTTC